MTQPVIQEVTEWDDFTGRLEPIKSVEVRARVVATWILFILRTASS